MADATTPKPVEKPVPKLVTWLGEEDQHYTLQEGEDGDMERQPAAGPSFMYWARVRFDKDKPVLIDPDQAPSPDLKLVYEHILKKAPNMPTSFKVGDVEEYDTSEEDGEEIGDDEDKHAKRKPKIQAIPKRRR